MGSPDEDAAFIASLNLTERERELYLKINSRPDAVAAIRQGIEDAEQGKLIPIEEIDRELGFA